MKKNDSLEELLLALTENLSDEELLLAMLQADIAATIAVKRIQAEMSQAELAQAMGVSQGLVSRWESGETNFTLATLVKIAQKLSIDMISPYKRERPPIPAEPRATLENVIYPDAWNSSGQGYVVLKSEDQRYRSDAKDGALKEM